MANAWSESRDSTGRLPSPSKPEPGGDLLAGRKLSRVVSKSIVPGVTKLPLLPLGSVSSPHLLLRGWTGGFLGGFSKGRWHVGPEDPRSFLIWEFGEGLEARNLKNTQSRTHLYLQG